MEDKKKELLKEFNKKFGTELLQFTEDDRFMKWFFKVLDRKDQEWKEKKLDLIEEAVRGMLYGLYDHEKDLTKQDRMKLHELGGKYTDDLLIEFRLQLQDKLSSSTKKD